MEKINESFIEQIIQKSGKSPFQTLTGILNLNKEAIYRRLRGQVPFMYSEAALIARKLNISLDHLNNISSDSYIFYPTNDNTQENKSEGYIDFFFVPDRYISDVYEGSFSFVFPSLPLPLITQFKYLSKLRYYRWIHENRGLQIIKESFSEIDFDSMYDKIPDNYLHFKHNTKSSYIVTSGMFELYINYIKYFQAIGSVNEDDIVLLKKDMMGLIDEFELIASSGEFRNGSKVDFYLTDFIFESAPYGYYENEVTKISFVRVFGMNFIFSTNEEMFTLIKKSILDMKGYTTLISITGSSVRRSFFQSQRELVDKKL